MGCEVVGIELNPEAAKRAAQHCATVIVGDVEKDALERLTGKFDVITFGDVLEHLVCPGAVLLRSRAYLTENGCVLVSLPNVAHYTIRLRLLLGRFDYEQCGLMDHTHLRFFTLRTAKRMLEEAGYAICDFDVVHEMRGTRLLRRYKRLESFIKRHFATLIALQFVFKAVKVPCRKVGIASAGEDSV
jgi:SAM-dependent methyltransferase